MNRYFVICSFDLKNGSREDYDKVYSALRSIGLERVVTSDAGKGIVMPTTTVAGQIERPTAGEAASTTAGLAQGLFQRKGLNGAELFVVAAGDWAWSARTS